MIRAVVCLEEREPLELMVARAVDAVCRAGGRGLDPRFGADSARQKQVVREDFLAGMDYGLKEAIREMRCLLTQDELVEEDFWELVTRLNDRLEED